MEAGPWAGLTASITVPGAATARAASPMARVMEAVVLGLTMVRCMGLVARQVITHAATPQPTQ